MSSLQFSYLTHLELHSNSSEISIIHKPIYNREVFRYPDVFRFPLFFPHPSQTIHHAPVQLLLLRPFILKYNFSYEALL